MTGEEILRHHGISPAEIRRLVTHPSGAMESDGRLVFLSRPFEQLLGFEATEVLGTKPPFPWWPPEDRERLAKLASLITTGVFAEFRMLGTPVAFQCRDGRRVRATTEYACWGASSPGGTLHVSVITGVEDEAGRFRTPDPGELVERIRLDLADLFRWVDALEGSPQEVPAVAGLALLTSRERDVLGLLLAGAERGEIARSLSIRNNTLRNHVGSIYRKLGVHSRKALSRLFSSGFAGARAASRR